METDEDRLAALLLAFDLKKATGEACSIESFREEAGELFEAFARILRTESRIGGEAEGSVGGASYAPPDLGETLPREFGAFTLERIIGRGGVGTVYAAIEHPLERRVAVKILRGDWSADPVVRLRFERGARAAASIEHDHVIRILGAGVEGGRPWIAMPLLRSLSLHEVLAELRASGGPVGSQTHHAILSRAGIPSGAVEARETSLCGFVRRMASVLADAADGLAAIHARGLIHRDVKPGNLFLDAPGRLIVGDFDLARETDASGSALTTNVATPIGTRAYMSPEQWDPAAGPLDGRSDVYSLGAVLFEALTLRPLIEGGAGFAQVAARSHASRDPRRLVPGLPRDAVRAVLRALERRPADRYASAAELAADLHAVAEGRPGRAPSLGERVRTGRRALRRNLGVLAAAALILGFGTWAVWWSARKGTLHVRTNAAAIVSIDGEDVGTSPLDLALSAGVHRVRIRLENHRDHAEDVRVEGDTTTSVERTLMPLTPIEAATVAINASGPALEKIRTTGDPYRLVARLCAAGERSTAEAYARHVFDPMPAGLRAELSRWSAWSGDRAAAHAADIELDDIEHVSKVFPMPPNLGREILDRLGRLVLPADPPPSLVVRRHYVAGYLHSALGTPAEAVRDYTTAADLARDCGWLLREHLSLLAIRHLPQAQPPPAEFELLCARGVALGRAMNDETSAAEFGYARAEALLVLRRFEDGRLACEEFAPWFESHPTHPSAARFLALRTFFAATALGPTATLAALVGLDKATPLSARAGKLDVSLLRGDALAKLGRIDEARSALDDARKWASRWKVPASEVAARLALARCDEIQGDHAGLRDDLEAAGRAARAANSLDMTVTVMVAEATHLRSAGSLDAARDVLLPALKLLDGRPEALVPVRALLGDLEIDRGAFVDGERYLREALAAPPSTAVPLITARAAAAVSLGVLLSRRGLHDEGLARLREGLETLRAQGDLFAQASTQVLLARALLSVGPSQEGLDLLVAAEQTATTIGADDVLARAAAIRADALRATGDAEAALAAVRQADGLVQRALRWRTGDGGGELPREGARLYGVGVWAAMKLGRPDDLLWSLERSRAIDFLVSLGGTRSLPLLSLPAELRESLVTSESRLEDLRIHRSDDGSSGSGGAAPINDGRREADLAAVVRNLAKARASADTQFGGGPELPAVEPIDLAAVRVLVGRKAVFVEYGAFAGRLMALVVDAASARVVDLGALDVVGREVGALVEAMRTENDARASSEDAIATVTSAVARLVVAPLALPAEAELVVISSDAVLRDLAFSLLLPGRSLALVPSASIWAALVARAQGSGEGVLALPDAAATEPRLHEGLASRPRWAVLHVGCRGLVDDRSPPFGSISLASSPSSDAETWTHREVLATTVNADLVVLTGCGASRTAGARREGAVGLVHAFLYAGAPSVLSARWPVDDDATKILLARFHERWRPKDGSPGVSPATALRDAQQAVRESERFRHPRFYAGWELHGVPGSP